MTRKNATYDDVLAVLQSITEQLSVLVSAVDDLRCEVEWQARNSDNQEHSQRLESANEPSDEWVDPAGESDASRLGTQKADTLQSAAGRLEAYERALMKGRRGLWMEEWIDHDELDVQIPPGLVFSVSESVWNDVIGICLVHIVGAECHCTDTEGEPYVLAWQTDKEFLVRGLTDVEARGLQALCLDRAEQAKYMRESVPDHSSEATQLGLF